MSTPRVKDRDAEPARVLAVADWSIDPHAVAEAMRAEGEAAPTVFGLLVPARLPGLDWIGDPYASRPCAERQLDRLERLANRHGLMVEGASVGDPERVAAIRASLETWRPDRILLFDRRRMVPTHPLSVARRVARRTGHVVERVALPPAPSARWRFPRRAPRCVPANAQAS